MSIFLKNLENANKNGDGRYYYNGKNKPYFDMLYKWCELNMKSVRTTTDGVYDFCRFLIRNGIAVKVVFDQNGVYQWAEMY